MLNSQFDLLKSNEYFVDTCCSLNENEKLYLSCGLNEKIHLNLIQIYYNSDEYCSSELYCCKYQTKCSRRITKYSSLHCDEQNSCWIDKSCLKIYDPCSSIYGLYGQYITIHYSCLEINETNSFDSEEPVPFLVKLSTIDETTIKSFSKKDSLKDLLITDNFKSSPLFLISIIFLFLVLLFLTYWLADLIGKKICRQNRLKKNVKTNTMSTKIFLEHPAENKIKVQSNSSLPITRIYPSYSNYQYYPFNSYQRYINVQHDPLTGQIYSRTFYPYWNY
jgi:hypothetical protein